MTQSGIGVPAQGSQWLMGENYSYLLLDIQFFRVQDVGNVRRHKVLHLFTLFPLEKLDNSAHI